MARKVTISPYHGVGGKFPLRLFILAVSSSRKSVADNLVELESCWEFILAVRRVPISIPQ